MSALHSLFLVGRHAFLQTLRGKRLLLLLLLVAVPVVIAVLFATARENEGLLDYQNWALGVILIGVVPLAALYLGVAVVGDEIDGRTITFLFTRPIPRPVLYLGRFIGIALAFLLLLALSIALSTWTFIGRAPVDALGTFLTWVTGSVGFLVYGALFAALRLFVKRALLLGFLIAFVIEGTVRSLPPGGFGTVSIGHHLMVLQMHVYKGVLKPGQDLLEGVGIEEGVAGSAQALCWFLALSLLVGVWRIRSGEIRVPSSVA